MTYEEKNQTFECGYREGFFFAAQALASRMIRLINNHPSWMLEPDRKQAIASLKLTTKNLLEKRGIIPFRHDVIIGKAEDIPVNFDLYY